MSNHSIGKHSSVIISPIVQEQDDTNNIQSQNNNENLESSAIEHNHKVYSENIHRVSQANVPQNINPLSMSIREYLDTFIVPALIPALNSVVTERPECPVAYLAHFLLDQKYNNKETNEEEQ